MCKIWLESIQVGNCVKMHLDMDIFKIMSVYLSLCLCLQCFDAVGWEAGKASGLQKLSGEVLAWLSVWSKVQMICIWSS